MKFSKKVVTAIIIMNVIFTIAVFYAFLKVGSEPYGLVAAWFSFTGVELWSLASIKKTEEKAKADSFIFYEEGKGE